MIMRLHFLFSGVVVTPLRNHVVESRDICHPPTGTGTARSLSAFAKRTYQPSSLHILIRIEGR